MNAVYASLNVFSKTNMQALREKSLQLTGYVEHLMLNSPSGFPSGKQPFSIITPSDPAARGAQLSVRLEPGLLDGVFSRLVANGIILDERKPDVIRVAPAPLYNSFSDVWNFTEIFHNACREALKERGA